MAISDDPVAVVAPGLPVLAQNPPVPQAVEKQPDIFRPEDFVWRMAVLLGVQFYCWVCLNVPEDVRAWMFWNIVRVLGGTATFALASAYPHARLETAKVFFGLLKIFMFYHVWGLEKGDAWWPVAIIALLAFI